ncbi:MAG: TonB-dependent receptor [Bacteroidetes bacterium]|nr:TonB-dependent receptor [Bacteroidota bacterium]
MKIKFRILLFYFFNFQILFAGSIIGTIVKKGTTEPIPNVDVFINALNKFTKSKIDGKFDFQNLPEGEYEISFSSFLFQKVLLKNVPVYRDRISYLNIEMELATVELEPIIISMNKKIIEKDLPSTFYNMKHENLKQYPLTTVNEIIALQPGVTMEGNVRGGKTSETLILIDGIPSFDYLGGSISSELPRFVIQDLSLNTGGFEAEFGNALSGIVSISTSQSSLNPVNRFRIETDYFLPQSTSKQTNKLKELEFYKRDKLFIDSLTYSFGINFKTLNGRWWQDLEKFYTEPLQTKLSSYGKMEYLFSPLEKISLHLLTWKNNWHDYEFSWRFNLDGLPIRNEEVYRGTLLYSFANSTNTTYSFSVSATSFQNSIGNTKPSEPFTPFQYDIYLQYILDGEKLNWANDQQFIYTLKGDVTFEEQKDHIIKSGFDFTQFDLTSNQMRIDPQKTLYGKPKEDKPMLSFINNYHKFPKQASFYIQDKFYYANDGSVLSFGLRYDFLDPQTTKIISNGTEIETKANIQSNFSPRLGLSLKITPQSMLHINVGQYVQFPLFNYLYAGTNPSTILKETKNIFRANPELKAEKTQAWEIGVKYFPNEKSIHSITYFNKKTKDQIDTKTFIAYDSKFAGDFGFAEYVNNAEATSNGIEYLFNYENNPKISSTFSYTWMVTEGVSEYVDQSINFIQWGFPIKAVVFPLSWDQRHSVKLNLESELFYDFRGSVIALYNTGRPFTYFPTRDGFTPLDSTKDFLPNNKRMSDVFLLHSKITRKIKFNTGDETFLLFYVEARNILNKRNVRWMDSNGRIGGELGDPTAFYELRRVNLGIEVHL